MNRKRRQRILPYNPKLVPVARMLRKNSTLAEILLWQRLKKKQLLDYDFHRQKPIGNYIVDFFSSELLFAIEIDGSSHSQTWETDYRRQCELEVMGVTFIRFSDREVKKEMDSVLEDICWMIEQLRV